MSSHVIQVGEQMCEKSPEFPHGSSWTPAFFGWSCHYWWWLESNKHHFREPGIRIPINFFKVFWNSYFFSAQPASKILPNCHISKPIGSMYGIFTYICHKFEPNVGEYTIHGSYGKYQIKVKGLRECFHLPSVWWQPEIRRINSPVEGGW